jgi:arylsulfatase A-like enzyme
MRTWLTTGAVGLLIMCSGRGLHGEQVERSKHPNILFILADDLGYGDLGCYGQKQIVTPNLDRLAQQGMRFRQCYAGSTVCAPSRCCLMTGLHTGHATIRGNGVVPLSAQDVTVAQVLKGAEYATGVIGKWGLGEPTTSGIPGRKGFDYFYGYLNHVHAHNYYPDYLWKNEERVRITGNVIEVENVASQRGQYAPELCTQEAIEFLNRNRAKPFFLYLAYTLPHANNERERIEGNGMEVPSDAPYGDKPWPQVEKNHAAMISFLDTEVGKVLKRLDELGSADETIVFFSSDNGPHKEGGADPLFFHSAGPLRGHKRDLYEGGIRVPLIVRWPGQVQAGAVSDQVCAFWDFLPTAAELAGVKPPPGLDGISQVPTLLNQGTQRQHEFLYWEFHERGFQPAVRWKDWKALRLKPNGLLELYDLAKDIDETHDVAAEHPNVIKVIDAYLKTARTASRRWPGATN